MVFPAFDQISPGDYLAIETRTEQKHEYFEGRMYARARVNLNHNIIVSNLIRKIGLFINNKAFNIFGSDLRITTPSNSSYLYPDVSIIGSCIELQENSYDTVTNPVVIIEVMSPTTKGYDMAFKFHFYKQIPSLLEYILVDSTRHYAQINRKMDNGQWQEAIDLEHLHSEFVINAFGMNVPFDDIYSKVSFA